MKFRKLAVLIRFIKYPLLLAGVLFASLMIASNLFMSDVRTVQIQYDGGLKKVVTTGTTVKEALDAAGIEVSDKALLSCDPDDSLDSVSKIVIESPHEFTVNVRGEDITITTFSDTVSEALAEAGITLTGSDRIEGAELDEVISEGMNISINSYTEYFYDELFTLGHDVKYVEDNDMLKGQSRTVVEGNDGFRTLFYRVYFENGAEVTTEIIKEEYVEPVDTVIAYGTIPNFTNSRGQTIAYTKSFKMSATAYSPTPGNWGYQTYTGNTNREGGVAVDPDVIPLGTKLYVKGLNGNPDYGFAVAWDIGKSIKGNKIDLFMESEDTCIWWGVKDVEVYVLDDQSEDIFALRNGRLFVNR